MINFICEREITSYYTKLSSINNTW